ncbi:MAG: T9SS type A sorting domain-containing protein [Prevotella sp.]|jgi:hypothetical protein|nr:T9SS type A sorting domain-containing protein [Prevotella sp.]
MKKLIYTVILLAGFQFTQAQKVENILRITAVSPTGVPSQFGSLSGQTMDLKNLGKDSINGRVQLRIAVVFRNTQFLGDSLKGGSMIASQIKLNGHLLNDTAYTYLIKSGTFIEKDSIGLLASFPLIPVSWFNTEALANEICYEIRSISLRNNNNVYSDYIPATTTNSFCVTFSVANIPNLDIADANSLNMVGVYPNPVRDNLKFENLNELTDIHVYSVTGQLIQSRTAVTGNIDMDVSNLSNGVYVIKMQNKKHVYMKKIQVIR